MHGPPLVAWLLVALGAATGAYCLVRTRPGCPGAARKEREEREERSVARAEALMGVGMAVMAVPVSVLDQPSWAAAVLALVFGVAAVRSLLLARHHAHHRHHAVGAAAMVYMAAAMEGAGGSAHAGHGAMGAPLLTGLLLVYFAVYVLAAGVRLVSVPVASATGAAGATRAVAVRHAPELASACRVSMAIGMFAMLLTL
ncbi:DUF5134 domain-containing protein [Streptomyces sp. NPDC058691]|uniref:DUF5134 domain-containing protein n=1 Tax=Streptomyces sp. NPDC058691 TaxID=3346601 RepID=UPI0036547F5D